MTEHMPDLDSDRALMDSEHMPDLDSDRALMDWQEPRLELTDPSDLDADVVMQLAMKADVVRARRFMAQIQSVARLEPRVSEASERLESALAMLLSSFAELAEHRLPEEPTLEDLSRHWKLKSQVASSEIEVSSACIDLLEAAKGKAA